MIEFQPTLTARSLAEVEPGSLVQRGNKIGFCAINPSQPTVTKTRHFVFFDAEAHAFVFEATQAIVVDFGNAPTIRPDTKSLVEYILPQNATVELLTDSTGPKIIVTVERTGKRILDLNTGELALLDRTPSMVAFRDWELGLAVAGHFYSLLKVFGSQANGIE